MKLKFQVNNLVRIADIKGVYSKGDMTNWSHKLYQITEIIKNKIPSYRNDNLQEHYNEALLKKTELSIEENNNVMKELNITQTKSK